MQYGHSWIPVVIFGGMFLMRHLNSQRRRGGPPAGPGPRSQFTRNDSRGRAESPPAPPSGGDGTPAGWFRDPFVRHEQRLWSGTEWTDHVLDDGVPGTDPPPTPPGTA